MRRHATRRSNPVAAASVMRRGAGLVPLSAPRFCATARCSRLTRSRFCPDCERTTRREAEARRGTASSRGYGHKWRKARLHFLAENPLCIDCLAEDKVEPATEVDHDEPHKGDMALFWDESKWRARCKPHHSKKTATEDGGWGRV